MSNIISALYWYCTDFCVNFANLVGISYEEFNIMLFLFLIPGLILILFLANVYRYVIRPLKNKKA